MACAETRRSVSRLQGTEYCTSYRLLSVGVSKRSQCIMALPRIPAATSPTSLARWKPCHDVAMLVLAEIITRRFVNDRLGSIHAEPLEWISPKLLIRRIDSGNPRYLTKEALGADREAFASAFIEDLRGRDRLPDLIHAHFADAADVARRVERVLGIPYIYTAHSLGIDKRAAMDQPVCRSREPNS